MQLNCILSQKDIQNVKNIKKIKNIKQIDGDLAEEMKDEIERGAETDYEVTVNQKKDKSHKIQVLKPF